MSTREIQLGWKVRDRITGYTGIVNHVVEYGGQGLSAGVQPTELSKEGDIRSGEVIDVAQLEVLDDKPLFEIPEAVPFKFKIGDRVRDTLTEFEGKVAGLARYINGCNRVLIRPKHKAEDKENFREGKFFAEAMLELVEEGKKEVAPTKRGGPSGVDSFVRRRL